MLTVSKSLSDLVVGVSLARANSICTRGFWRVVKQDHVSIPPVVVPGSWDVTGVSDQVRLRFSDEY